MDENICNFSICIMNMYLVCMTNLRKERKWQTSSHLIETNRGMMEREGKKQDKRKKEWKKIERAKTRENTYPLKYQRQLRGYCVWNGKKNNTISEFLHFLIWINRTNVPIFSSKLFTLKYRHARKYKSNISQQQLYIHSNNFIWNLYLLLKLEELSR